MKSGRKYCPLTKGCRCVECAILSVSLWLLPFPRPAHSQTGRGQVFVGSSLTKCTLRTQPNNQWPLTIEWHTNVEPSRWYICRFGDSCRTSSADEANVGAEDSHCRSSGDGSDIGLAGDHQWLTDSKSNPTQHLCPPQRKTHWLSAHTTTFTTEQLIRDAVPCLLWLTDRHPLCPEPSETNVLYFKRQLQTVGPADKCWQMVVVVPTGPVSLLIIYSFCCSL